MLRLLRNATKRVLFGKRKNYHRRGYGRSYLKSMVFSHNKDINNLHTTLNNLMTHLKIEKVGNSNLIADKKDNKKFDGKWN